MRLKKKRTILIGLFTGIFIFLLFNLSPFTANSSTVDDKANLGTTTPVINELQEITSSDGNSVDYFGLVVAIDDNTAVVGARFNDENGSDGGAAYVYVKSGTNWALQQKLLAGDGDSNDIFGTGVSISGDTVVVGANGDEENGSNSGSAYVFTRTGTVWTEQQKLLADDGAANDQFGFDVDIDGETIAVGAYGDQDQGSETGAAYIFVRSGIIWTQEEKITASDGASSDRFAFDVGLSGNTLVVGAPLDDDVGTNSGSAYVYVRSGMSWAFQQKLIPTGSSVNDLFGASVSIDAETLVVGSYSDDENVVDGGSAYVFTRSGMTWTLLQKLFASDGAVNDRFGIGVSISGNRIVSGAYLDDDNSQMDSGSIYLFERSGTTWAEHRKLLASNGAASDLLGYGVAISGETVIGGAYFRDVASFTEKTSDNTKNLAGADQGAVFIFDVLSGIYCQPVQPDLISWWTGDGNGLDIRSRNDGTLQNGATYGTGKVGEGFSFDGIDDYFEIPDSPGLNPINEITMDGWVYPTATSGGTDFVGMIINKSTSPAANQYEVGRRNNTACTIGGGIPEGNLAFLFDGLTGLPNNCNGWIDGLANLPVNTWTHFAVTYDGSSVNVYANGALTRSISGVSGSLLTTNGSIRFSGRNGFSDSQFQGNIDEIQIFDRALQQTEIQASFDADGRGKCKPTATVKPSGLVGSWAGDGDANEIENGADGTLLNGTGFSIGKVGQAFTFNNMNQFIEAPDANLPMGANERTTEMWIKPNNNARVTAIYGTQTALSAFYPIVIGNNICIGRFGGGDQCGTTNIIDGNWHHIAITYDGASTTTLYLDGQVERIVTRSYNTTSNGGLLRIGNTFSGSSDSFDGDMDEISIYDRALTLTEIRSIFDTDLAGKLKSVDTSSTPFSGSKFGKHTNIGTGVVSQVGDATVTFSSVTADGTTQQIPFDINDMPALPSGIITGLQYDISTSAIYTGDVNICFNLPAFTTSIDFAGLRVLHLENNIWTNRTTTSDFASRTLCSSVTSLSPFAIIKFAPTAANVAVAGKVLNANGQGIPNALVSVSDQNGNVRTATSNNFGNYNFQNIQAGETYTFTIWSKQHQFVPQVINVSKSITNLNFVAN